MHKNCMRWVLFSLFYNSIFCLDFPTLMSKKEHIVLPSKITFAQPLSLINDIIAKNLGIFLAFPHPLHSVVYQQSYPLYIQEYPKYLQFCPVALVPSWFNPPSLPVYTCAGVFLLICLLHFCLIITERSDLLKYK